MDSIRRTFSSGWLPDADSVNAPPDALLRADNLVLDELGALVLRGGSAKVSANLGAAVHSLFTVVRSGTRLRYAGSGNDAFRNGSSIVTFGGSGDIIFGSYLGYTFIARGSTKKKDDGTTVRNWGIAMTGGAPTAVLQALVNVSIATWDSSETGNHTMVEDNGTGLAYTDSRSGVPNGAVVMVPNSTTFRAIITRSFASDQNFGSAVGGGDNNIIAMYIFTTNAGVMTNAILQIDVNDGTFQEDTYTKVWPIKGAPAIPETPDYPPGAPPPDGIPGEPPLI